jgi:hypothetical protein
VFRLNVGNFTCWVASVGILLRYLQRCWLRCFVSLVALVVFRRPAYEHYESSLLARWVVPALKPSALRL